MPSDNPAPLVKLSLPLQYQQDIFSGVRTQDELVILAQGLGLLRIITNLLHGYDAAGNSLVLVVGADDQENEWIGEALAEHHAVSRTPLARGLKVINTDNATVRMRQKIYSQGGVLSVTSRILIVDLLSKVLDPQTITGIVILHAEKVVATSLEAFIIRVYRQFNKDGFLKAFSDRPEPFTTGFAPLANMLRNLFLQKTSLWPRFQVTVAESLEGDRRAEVIELEVPMTEKMREIQNAVLECVEVNIRELKRANSGLDVEDWTVDSALHKNFDVTIRRQLDPVWHRVSFRTRQIANDLTVLRSILHSLLTYDSVSLLKYLDTILAAHSAPPGSTRQNFSPWLFLDAAHILFQTAKSRVYRGKVDGRELSSSTGLPDKLEPVLEAQPKWQVLTQVLDEIERDLYLNPVAGGDSNAAILIMCSDQRTSRQIREYLQTMHVKVEENHHQTNSHDDSVENSEESGSKPTAEFMMRRKLREYLRWKPNFRRANDHLSGNKPKKKEAAAEVPGYSSVISARPSQQHTGRAPPNKRRRIRGSSSSASTPARTPNTTVQAEVEDSPQVSSLLEDIQQQPGQEEDAAEQANVLVDDDLDNMEDYYELYDMDDLVITHSYGGDIDDHILEETRPRYIVMFEPDAAFIRRVEVYRSSHANRNVRVYFMYYGESVEERRYLSAVRREKDAFTKLIKEKGTMAMSITHDKSLEDPQEQFLRTVNTRIAGGGRLAATAAPPTVVIDVREFRSALPSLLHGRSMVVLPCQITVGDYILSPDICVERKSVRDLISSLKSGRLYNQTETMLQHYKSPVLLIEFDQNKAFTFDAFTSSSASSSSSAAAATSSSSSASTFIPDNATALSTPSFASGNLINPTNPRSAQHLLVLLTLSFPRLKIIWSSSPYQTAEIFAELKKNNPEPDPVRAVQIGLDFDIGTAAVAGAGAGTTGDSAASNPLGAAGIEHRAFNQLPQDMLSTVPGVTPKALERLVLETRNIHQVANMEVEELDPLVGKEVARKIVGYFRRSVFEEELEVGEKG